MRRDFQLSDEDIRALEALGLSWETVKSSNALWVLIYKFPVPDGYTCTTVTLGIRVDTYPPGPLDMAYFSPSLERTDGKKINNLSTISIEERTFQQWSRHYSWNSTLHTLSTHIRRIRSWLSHEFRKR